MTLADLEQMIERQRLLADFGSLALRSDDLDEVLTEACRLVAKALNCDLAKVIEVEEEGQTLLVRAGVGWQPGVIGKVRLPMGSESSETYSIEKGVPVCTPNIHEENRFKFPDFMKEAGVVGAVNVPIFFFSGKAYGLLEVDSRVPWKPDRHDTEFLRTYAALLAAMIDRLQRTHALTQAVERSDTLLRELQHRIKNNIGAIMSLVRMRMSAARSEDVRNELDVIGNRIETLRLVHDQVYGAERGDRLSLRTYLTSLLERVLALHAEARVRLEASVEDIEITSDLAIPLGLVLNEFTTNSLKHAFDRERATGENIISVEAHQRDDRLWICIQDNGVGLPTQSQVSRPGSGTGMALIKKLARQIGATPEWTSEAGTTLCLEFKRGD